MSVETALIAYLETCTAVTAIAATICYGVVPPSTPTADKYPAVTVQRVSDATGYTFGGYSGLTFSRLQVTCWARTPLAMLSLRDAVFKLPADLTGAAGLNGFQGSWNGLAIGCCLKLDEADMDESALAEPGLQAARVYGRRLDFRVGYNEELA